MSSVFVLVIVLWSVTWACGLCLAYYGYKFYQLRHQTVYIKRRGNIVTSYTLCASLLLLTAMPLFFFTHQEWQLPPNQTSPISLVIDIVNDFFFFPFYHIGAWLMLCRYWLIYYDIQFTTSCQSIEWKKLITSDMHSLRKEKWFIDKRTSFGNAKYMTNLSICIACIIAVICIINSTLNSLQIGNSQFYLYFQAVIFVLMLVCYIVIWRKMSFFNDTIYLYKEFRMISYCWFAAIIAYVTIHIVISLFQSTLPDNQQTVLVVSSLIFLSLALPAFVIPFISTFWVLRHIATLNASPSQVDSASQLQRLDSQSVDGRKAATVPLSEILSDNESLNLFAAHLSDEFSIELLLSLIEFHQYKTYALNALHKTSGIDNVNDTEQNLQEQQTNIRLPDDFPDSDIVANDGKVDEEQPTELTKTLKMKAHKLYQKYIVVGCEFEINISYVLRGGLSQRMINYDDWMQSNMATQDLINIFDDCMLQMIMLLNWSKQRFQFQRV